jgi:Fe-S oxidoreductase
MPPTAPSADDAIVLDDAAWEELVSLTNGAAAQCYQCGVCTAICPWGSVRDEALSVRTLMRQAQLGIHEEGESENLWLCATCAQCEAYCPRGVSITDALRGLRYLAWERRAVPEGLPSLLWSVHWNNNPWEQPPSQRTGWTKNLDVPLYDPARHDFLYYVGCTPSYDARAQKVALALTRVFQAVEVPFGILGEDEPCCGEAVLNVGHKPYFEEIAQHTAEVFQEKGVRQLVTISPHCYDVFQNHYPRPSGDFQPTHYTQLLSRLVDDGRLKFKGSVERKAAFHDPCTLARHNAETEAPRRVLEAIPGIELVEMEHNGVDTLCCGGGGGRMWMETAAGERFSDLRVEEALTTGVDVLVTACPFCIACLEDSLKAQKIKDIVVMDVAELAALAL